MPSLPALLVLKSAVHKQTGLEPETLKRLADGTLEVTFSSGVQQILTPTPLMQALLRVLEEDQNA